MRGGEKKRQEKREAQAIYFHHQTVIAVGTESKQQRRDEVEFNRRCVEEM